MTVDFRHACEVSDVVHTGVVSTHSVACFLARLHWSENLYTA